MWARSRIWTVVWLAGGSQARRPGGFHRWLSSMAGGRVGFTTVVFVVVTGVADVDPGAAWCAEGSMCACVCPCWDRGADSACTIGFAMEPGAVSALLEGEVESGGDGSLETSLSLSFGSLEAYRGEDFCRDRDERRGVESREWLLERYWDVGSWCCCCE